MPKPFSDFPVKEQSEGMNSAKSLVKVREWLDVCRSSHKLCTAQASNTTVLPKRVLDVSAGVVKLHESNEEQGLYVCLSHCWGGVEPACKTTSDTIESNKRGIDPAKIPATFRDAIDFTRSVGYRYLWIDSICIIQDNHEDWALQSSLMAEIYANAVLTICATSAANDNGGLYLETPENWLPQRVRIEGEDKQEYEVYVRYDLDDRHIPGWESTAMKDIATNFPLLTRAWTYQERLLSPRLVHFTKGELMWECSELSDCECWQSQDAEPSPYMQQDFSTKGYYYWTLLEGKSTFDTSLWSNIMSVFTGLNLTLSKDKLPALSGVVKQVMSSRPGDEYLAGLWRKTIIRDLCWIVWSRHSRRPLTWRCPSWSWGSLDGPVRHGDYRIQAGGSGYAECLDASITLAGPDQAGAVSFGYVILNAVVVPVSLLAADEWTTWGDWYLTRAGYKLPFLPDCESNKDQGGLMVDDKLVCLRLAKSTDGVDWCLILKQIRADDPLPVYKRVGILNRGERELGKFWFSEGLKSQRVKIV